MLWLKTGIPSQGLAWYKFVTWAFPFKNIIFLWKLLDCFMVMELSSEPFWVWTKATSIAPEGRTELSACRLHSWDPETPDISFPENTLHYWPHCSSIEGSNCGRLRRGSQEGTVFLLKSLPTNGRRAKNKINSSNMTRQLEIHDVHNSSIFVQEWREFCYKLKLISAKHAFGLVRLSMISL